MPKSKLLREVGDTGILVTPIAMGCWPIAGITSLDVTEKQSREALEHSYENGINFFDTAFSYGYEGESEKLIGDVFYSRRDQIVVATKAGLNWNEQKQRQHDCSPQRIRLECEESLRRLRRDSIDLYYLHAWDEETPLASCAEALQKLLDEGKIRSIGVSNLSLDQLQEMEQECKVSACQPHYNMLQREIEEQLVPYALKNQISLMTYWPLMKGLLAGKLARDHHFHPKDGRAKYPMFQGDEWQKNQDFVDELRTVAKSENRSVAQVVINWTIHRPGITAALCGAKRADQATENAESMGWQLSEASLAAIAEAIDRRGTPQSRAAV